MNKNQRKSRRYSKKALSVICEIQKKFPNKISDVSKISEESRAWIQVKIQQFRECIKNVKFPTKPSWWETMRLTRNKTAHQEEDFSDEEFSKIISELFDNIEKISADLQENIKRYKQKSKKKRDYENASSTLLGTKNEKAQLVDAMEDLIEPVEPQEIKIEFPKNIFAQAAQKTLCEILKNQNLHSYMIQHEGICENIQTDILEWLEKTNLNLEKENPFFDEEIFVEEQKRLTAQELAFDISNEKSKIETNYKNLPSVNKLKRGTISESNLDFNFYRKEFLSQKKIVNSENPKNEKTESLNQKSKSQKSEKFEWKSEEKLETLQRNFIADLENNLIERKNKWQQEKIDAERKIFLENLYKKIQNFMKLEKLVSPFINDFGRLWDLSNRPFETSGFELLEQFAKLLEKDKSLQEFAALLGKQNRVQQSLEKEKRNKVVAQSEWHPKNAYRGEINNLRYSQDISTVLPTELALFKNPAAKKLFQLKFAQKQLLSFAYQNPEEEKFEQTQTEEVNVEKKDAKGPIIICVDTSGSMRGTPENIAKTVTFALSKIAIGEERKCFLISFSTNIEILDLSDFKNGDALSKLVKFLQMSFNGGTDAIPPLKFALKKLKEEKWKNSDVLMISDFVMRSLDSDLDLVKKIEDEKKNKTDFYSLAIGTSVNSKVIKCFNHNWIYDMNDKNANRHLLEQLEEISS